MDGILTFFDVPYGDHERQVLDLCLPADYAGRGGLVLFIHGGAWIHGDKGSNRGRLETWSAKGYAAAAINYRYLSEDTHMDALISDISGALAVIKDLAAKNGASLDRALLTGESAGGHLSLLYAYSMADASPIRPVCVVDYCGPADLTDRELLYGVPERYPPEEQWIDLFSWLTGIRYDKDDPGPEFMRALKRYSPVSYVTKDTVPTVICHGQKDDIVPYAGALKLRDRLDGCGAEYVFLPMPLAGHSLDQPEIFEISAVLLETYAKRFLG